MTTVLNLATGKHMIFSLPPREAVKAAQLYSEGQHNTWQNDQIDRPVVEGQYGVYCGNWGALKRERPNA